MNELNKTDDHIQSSSVNVVNSLLDENNSWDSDNSYASSEYQAGESSSEYCPTPLKKVRHNPISLGNSLFICQTSQVQSFIDQINETALCHTPHCIGKLVLIEIKQIGLGGGAIIKFSCS